MNSNRAALRNSAPQRAVGASPAPALPHAGRSPTAPPRRSGERSPSPLSGNYANALKSRLEQFTTIRAAAVGEQLRIDEDAVVDVARAAGIEVYRKSGAWWLRGASDFHLTGRAQL